jgi:hypothetical protein
VEARREIHIEPRVIAEVAKAEMSQMHGQKMKPPAPGGEIFRGRAGLSSARRELEGRVVSSAAR